MKRIYDQKDLAYSGWDIEFDTVIGRIGGKALLTIVLLPSQIFIARLIDKKDQDHVCEQFDWLEQVLRKNRERQEGQAGAWWFFSTALTDRGAEMGDFIRLERSVIQQPHPDGEALRRTRVFYADPYSSWQKPHIEKLHTLLRMVLPKKSWFDHLGQKDIDLTCSHINSYSRARLDGATPFEAVPVGFSNKLIRALGQKRIAPDEVNLSPKLLDD
jgi:IS30 family transposase